MAKPKAPSAPLADSTDDLPFQTDDTPPPVSDDPDAKPDTSERARQLTMGQRP